MAKRKFMVMKRTADDLVIDVGRGKRKTWRQSGGKAEMFYVSDESEARDIDAKYGTKGTQQVWVKEHGNMGWERSYRDGVHNYFKGATSSYADAWDAFEKRRKDKKVKHDETQGQEGAGGSQEVGKEEEDGRVRKNLPKGRKEVRVQKGRRPRRRVRVLESC